MTVHHIQLEDFSSTPPAIRRFFRVKEPIWLSLLVWAYWSLEWLPESVYFSSAVSDRGKTKSLRTRQISKFVPHFPVTLPSRQSDLIASHVSLTSKKELFWRANREAQKSKILGRPILQIPQCQLQGISIKFFRFCVPDICTNSLIIWSSNVVNFLWIFTYDFFDAGIVKFSMLLGH